jgi:SAM-dependent methyltransferase
MRTFDPEHPEQIDRAQPVSTELVRSLRELEKLNRRFGGHRYLRRFLNRALLSGRSYRFLDFATGGGDAPRLMVEWARRSRVKLLVDAVDINSATISIAKAFSRNYPEIHFIQQNILNYESSEGYDFVHCSLSLHHFSTTEAIQVLKHCRDLSRHLLLITDLERSTLTQAAIHTVNALSQHQRMTVHDGDVSARRAFSFDEFRDLAIRAGWVNFGHERYLFCRQAVWLPRVFK